MTVVPHIREAPLVEAPVDGKMADEVESGAGSSSVCCKMKFISFV